MELSEINGMLEAVGKARDSATVKLNVVLSAIESSESISQQDISEIVTVLSELCKAQNDAIIGLENITGCKRDNAMKLFENLQKCSDGLVLVEFIKFLSITSDQSDYKSAILQFQEEVLSSADIYNAANADIVMLVNGAVASSLEFERKKENLRKALRERGYMEVYAGLLERAYKFGDSGVAVTSIAPVNPIINENPTTVYPTEMERIEQVQLEEQPIVVNKVERVLEQAAEKIAESEFEAESLESSENIVEPEVAHFDDMEEESESVGYSDGEIEWQRKRIPIKIKKMLGDFVDCGRSCWFATVKGKQHLSNLITLLYLGIISDVTFTRIVGQEEKDWLYNHGYIQAGDIAGGSVRVLCIAMPGMVVLNNDIIRSKISVSADRKAKSILEMIEQNEDEILRVLAAGEAIVALTNGQTVTERGMDDKNKCLEARLEEFDTNIIMRVLWDYDADFIEANHDEETGVEVSFKSRVEYDNDVPIGVEIESEYGDVLSVPFGETVDAVRFLGNVILHDDEAVGDEMQDDSRQEEVELNVDVGEVDIANDFVDTNDKAEIIDDGAIESEAEESDEVGDRLFKCDEYESATDDITDENKVVGDAGEPEFEGSVNDCGSLIYANPHENKKDFYEMALRLISNGKEHEALLLLGCLAYEDKEYECVFKYLRYVMGVTEWGIFEANAFSVLQNEAFTEVVSEFSGVEESLRLASRLVYLTFFVKNDWQVRDYQYANADGIENHELEATCKELITYLCNLNIQDGGYTEHDVFAVTDAQSKFKEYQALATDLINRPYTGRFDFRLKMPFFNDKIIHPCLQAVKSNDIKRYDEIVVKISELNTDDLVVDDIKLNAHLDKVWENANEGGKKDGEPFVGKAREQAYEYLKQRVDLINNWLRLICSQNNSNTNKNRFRNQILAAAQRILAVDGSDYATSIVKLAARRIVKFVGGEHENNFKVIAGLIASNEFIVAGGRLADVDAFSGIPGLEPWKGAVRHICFEGETDMNAVLDATENEIDKEFFGNETTRQSVCVLLNKEYQSVLEPAKLKRAADKIGDEFKSRIEKEALYGRIDEADKEDIYEAHERILRVYIDKYNELGKYVKACTLLEKQVDYIVNSKTEVFSVQLSEFQKNYPDTPILVDIERNILDKNFVVAEEYISRLQSGVTTLDEEELAEYSCSTEIEQFLDTYDSIYNIANDSKNKMGRFSAWAKAEYKKRRKSDATASDDREAEQYFATWDNKDVKNLLVQLGFAVTGMTVQSWGYTVNVTPPAKNRSSFSHPIGAFGTACKNINVLIFNGGNKTDRVIEDVEKLNPRGNATIVVFYAALTKAQREEILRKFKTETTRENSFLLLDYILGFYLSLVGKGNRLTSFLKCTIPYTGYKLYSDDVAVLPEMFAGRKEEQRKITDIHDGTTLVYGGRRLGKTALFNRSCEVENDPKNGRRAVYVSVAKTDGDGDNFFVDKLANELIRQDLIPKAAYKTNKEICDKLRDRLSRSDIKTLYLFIDEVNDYFKKLNDENDTTPLVPFDDLRKSKNVSNKFKYVFAGLHQVARYSRLNNNNSVIGQMSMPLVIKPLSPMETRRLIEYPFSYLGIKIEPQLIALLASRANYYPGSIQLICQMIVETVLKNPKLSPPYVVDEKLLEDVCGAAEINGEIKRKLMLTLESDSSNKKDSAYKAIAYIFVHYYYDEGYTSDGYDARRVLAEAKGLNIACLKDLDIEAVDALLGELAEMSILRKIKSNGYKLRKASFAELIEPDKNAVEEYLLSLEDME